MLLGPGRLSGKSRSGTTLFLASPGCFIDAWLLGSDFKRKRGAARSGTGSAAPSGAAGGLLPPPLTGRGWCRPGRRPPAATATGRGRDASEGRQSSWGLKQFPAGDLAVAGHDKERLQVGKSSRPFLAGGGGVGA